MDNPGFLTSITYQALHVRYRQSIEDQSTEDNGTEDDDAPEPGEVDTLIAHITDYHAVPALLGARKQTANLLYDAWSKRVSPGELIYTRQAGGRELLLKARARTFANNYVNETERIDRWQ